MKCDIKNGDVIIYRDAAIWRPDCSPRYPGDKDLLAILQTCSFLARKIAGETIGCEIIRSNTATKRTTKTKGAIE